MPVRGRRGAAAADGEGADVDGGLEQPLADRRLRAILGAAAEGVQAEIRRDLKHADEAQRDLLERLEELVRIVGCSEEPLRYRGLAVKDAALTHWLLDELRGRIVQESLSLSPSFPADHLIALLQSLERVREELSTSSDQQLARLLTSFRDLDLLVELAHDLRSPLTSIIFLSEALRQQQSGKVNPLQSRQLGIIYSAALGLVSMASNVIELVRGDRLFPDAPTAFSVRELMESIRDLVDPLAETKGLSLRTAGPERDRREGYPAALSRVLLNLTTNALKFTEKGYVEINAREVGSADVEFSVRDTGPGLVAGAGDVFSTLRVNPSGDRHGFSGSGLGLAISRRLLASMGAELRYETAEGEGTRFFFVLALPEG